MIDTRIFGYMMNAGQPDLRQQSQASGVTYYTDVPTQQNYASQPFQVSPAQILPSNKLPDSSALGTSASRPANSRPRPRPVTMHGSDFSGLNYHFQSQVTSAPWSPQAQFVPGSNPLAAQPFAVNQAFYQPMGVLDNRPTSMHLDQTYQKLTGGWNGSSYGVPTETNGMVLASNAGVPYGMTEASRTSMSRDMDTDANYNVKRISGSSFTMSTTGGQSEMAYGEDYPVSASETPSYVSDWPPQSNRTSLLSSIQSPLTSPRMHLQNGNGLHRTHSRGKASPSSKHSARSTPYSADGRNKRWSTGSYAQPSRSRVESPFMLHPTPEGFVQQQAPSFEPPGVYSQYQPLNMSNLQSQQNPYTSHLNHQTMSRNNMILPSNDYNERQILDNQAPHHISHSLVRMLQSNGETTDDHMHYDNNADRPDLRAALYEEQSHPPPSDMNPSDPSLIPHEQELRFDTDLYTPRWIRGHGKEREGWCGICKPGKWLILKTSAFWYDKSFMHGISAPTGKPFQEPVEMRRNEQNRELWEGSCGGCGEWVAMTSHKKKGTTWFRHAYRCHTHPKVKDPVKKRRKSLEKPPSTSQVAKPESTGSQNSPLGSSGSISRKTLESTPADYNMI